MLCNLFDIIDVDYNKYNTFIYRFVDNYEIACVMTITVQSIYINFLNDAFTKKINFKIYYTHNNILNIPSLYKAYFSLQNIYLDRRISVSYGTDHAPLKVYLKNCVLSENVANSYRYNKNVILDQSNVY